MDAAAITDHGTLSGVIEFYEQAQKHDAKPVLGSEAIEVKIVVASTNLFSQLLQCPFVGI